VPENYRTASENTLTGPWLNRLDAARSPYLRQHADNPVDWYPWGDEAFSEAERRDVPIFLSIGYAACHWCHVMEKESFSDPRIGALLNAHFVSIKVDREEHPDVDAFFMDVLLRMNGEAGWPASIWLTPSRQPLQGGTYYPPYFRYGMPAFSDAIKGVRDGWRHNRDRMVARAETLCAEIGSPRAAPAPAPPAMVSAGVARMLEEYDERYGGWGLGAKFPHPPRLALLLETPGDAALKAALHMLSAMDRGGIHDHLGGGFHRYAVDVEWEVPHFEKMLYDNAQLAGLYLKAWARSGERRMLTVGCETLEFLLSVFCDDETGLLMSSLDADDPGGEGYFYTWTPEELADALGARLAPAVGRAYGVTRYGNVEGRSVLNRKGDPSILSAVRRKLLAARASRAAPAVDDKVVVAWNAMAAESLALGGRLVGEPRYTAAAARILSTLVALQPLPRVHRGQAPGVLDDHAALLSALLAQHAADGEPGWLRHAHRIGQEIVSRFLSGSQLALSGVGDGGLPVRREQWTDHAEPAGSAWATLGLSQLASLGAALAPLEPLLAAGSGWAGEHPDACPTLLRALSLHHRPGQTIIVSGEDDGGLWRAAARRWLPRTLLVRSRPGDGLAELFSSLRGKGPEGPGRAWLCEGTSCQLPVRSPGRLDEILCEQS